MNEMRRPERRDGCRQRRVDRLVWRQWLRPLLGRSTKAREHLGKAELHEQAVHRATQRSARGVFRAPWGMHDHTWVAGELGGEEACNDALPRDALGQMLCARRTEVEERLRACAAASAGQQVGGPEAGGGGDEEQAAEWVGVQSSIQLLLEAERVAIDSSLEAMVEREEAEEAF